MSDVSMEIELVPCWISFSGSPNFLNLNFLHTNEGFLPVCDRWLLPFSE